MAGQLVTECTDGDPESQAGEEVADEIALGEHAHLARPENAVRVDGDD